MAHTKAGGKVSQKAQRKGKHLGVKLFAGEKVNPGQIILRQRGGQINPGLGVEMGRDFTIFALTEGRVHFKTQKGKQIVFVTAE